MRLNDLDPLVVEMAKDGDIASQHKIVESCKKLIGWMANRCASSLRTIDIEDLEQQGVLGVYDAINAFDPARGTFQVTVFLWVRYRVYRWCDKDANYGRRTAPMPEYEDTAGMKVRWDAVQPQEVTSMLRSVGEAMSELSPVERAAFEEMVLSDTTASEFSATFGHEMHWGMRQRRNATEKVVKFISE